MPAAGRSSPCSLVRCAWPCVYVCMRVGAKGFLCISDTNAYPPPSCPHTHLLSTIHIITEEQVVRLRGEPAVLKQPQEVIILPMNIACGWMDGWMCICGCVGVCVCVCRWMRLCVQIGWLFLHLHPYTHTHTDIHTHRKSLLAPRALARWAET